MPKRKVDKSLVKGDIAVRTKLYYCGEEQVAKLSVCDYDGITVAKTTTPDGEKAFIEVEAAESYIDSTLIGMEITTEERTSNLKSILSKVVDVPKGAILRSFGIGYNPADDVNSVMAADIEKMAKIVTRSYTDRSNVILHEEEMMLEMSEKLAQVIRNDDLFFSNKAKFMEYIKMSFHSRVKSLLQRHVYTIRRSGMTSEERDPKSDKFIRTKRWDVPIDAPISEDNSETTADTLGSDDTGYSEFEYREVLNHFMSTLTAKEKAVLTQEIDPNEDAMNLAVQNAKRNNVKISSKIKAKALGMNYVLYINTLSEVRRKFSVYKDENGL